MKRLHIGASKLEKLSEAALDIFIGESWTHMGNSELFNPNNKRFKKVDYSRTSFIPFYFKSGDKLPFNDETFAFIYSEHFLEHLFLGEAIDLLRESYRVLCKNGVIRIAVPDADLRPNPEKLGFLGDNYSFENPAKHKTRWSLYSLSPLMSLCGFRVNPLRYYDTNRRLHEKNLLNQAEVYKNCLDKELIFETKYIQRANSLIVDSIR